MKQNPNPVRKNNFTGKIVLMIVCGLFGIALLQAGLYAAVRSWHNSQYPSIEQLMKQKDWLQTDQYSKLPEKILDSDPFLVLDENGRVWFYTRQDLRNTAASAAVDEEDSMRDTEKVQETEEIPDAEKTPDAEETPAPVSKILTALQEEYGSTCKLEYYFYTTLEGDRRFLILVVPALTQRAFDNYRSIEFLAVLAGVLILLAGGMVLAVLVRRFLQKELAPITKAVQEYGNKGTYFSPEELPEELVPIDFAMQSLQEGLHKEQKAKQEAERKRTLMLLGISHDLKNPLAVISGSVDTLQNKELSEAEKIRLMTLMKENAQECAQLLDSFTYYSGMEQAAAHSRWENVDLCETVRTYLADRYGDIISAGDFLEADIPDREIPGTISEGLFRRALGNLVNNSIKHNPPGITIFAGIEEKEDEIILRIGDNGIGISPDIREHIFEPYVTSNTARTPGKGTGMGLAVAVEIVKAHGGELVLADPETIPSGSGTGGRENLQPDKQKTEEWSVIFEIRLKKLQAGQ